MNKKIIALCCVVVLIASIFAACGKTKLYTTEINGQKRPVVTNEDGEYITNADGEVAVYVTNAKGEQLTDDSGEPNVNYIKPPAALVNPNGKVFYDIFTYSVIDGWTASNSVGRMTKDGTDRKCAISFDYANTATEENTFKSITDRVLLQNNEVIQKINNGDFKSSGYEKAVIESKNTKFLDFEAWYMSNAVYNAEGAVVEHAQSIYFVLPEGEVYLIYLGCVGGAGYDESFNLLDWAQENVTVKIPYKTVK